MELSTGEPLLLSFTFFFNVKEQEDRKERQTKRIFLFVNRYQLRLYPFEFNLLGCTLFTRLMVGSR